MAKSLRASQPADTDSVHSLVEKKTTDYMTTDRGSNTHMHVAIISQEETTIQEEMGPVPGS